MSKRKEQRRVPRMKHELDYRCLGHVLIEFRKNNEWIQHYVPYPMDRPFGATVSDYVWMYSIQHQLPSPVILVEDGQGNKLHEIIK